MPAYDANNRPDIASDPIMPKPKCNGAKSPLVIISNLAPVNEMEGRFFRELVSAFRAHGCDPYVWSIPNKAYTDCLIPLSWTISKWPVPKRTYTAQEMDKAYSLIDVSKWRVRLGKLVKQYCDVSAEVDRLLEIVVRNSWDLLTTYRPSLFLSWNTLCPHTGILYDMCQKVGIPSFLIERAFFPNTWFIEPGGLLGHSILVDKTLGELIPRREMEMRSTQGAAILQNMQTKSYVKYAQQLSPKFDQLVRHPLATRPKFVFFPPDDGTIGFFPPDHDDRRKTLPGFQNSFDAARCLAAEYDGLVVFKPHPSFIGWEFDTGGIDNLIVLDHDFRELIDWADIVASTGSGLTFLAMNAGKPVLSMARDLLHNKGIVYEALKRSDIASAVCQAVADGQREEHRRNYQAFVSYLYTNYLVSIDGPDNVALNTPCRIVEALLQDIP